MIQLLNPSNSSSCPLLVLPLSNWFYCSMRTVSVFDWSICLILWCLQSSCLLLGFNISYTSVSLASLNSKNFNVAFALWVLLFCLIKATFLCLCLYICNFWCLGIAQWWHHYTWVICLRLGHFCSFWFLGIIDFLYWYLYNTKTLSILTFPGCNGSIWASVFLFYKSDGWFTFLWALVISTLFCEQESKRKGWCWRTCMCFLQMGP